MEDEFKNPKQLLDFVLTECSGIKYILETRYEKELTITITKDSSFNMERIFFADTLLKQKFPGLHISVLKLNNIDIDEIEDFLSKMSITKLDVSNNQRLKELPTLPDTLIFLIANNCSLKELPNLPDTLEKIHCQRNNLKELPPLPESLEILYCQYNQIEELPNLPDSIFSLDISHNKIEKIDKLPEILDVFDFSFNNVSTISIDLINRSKNMRLFDSSNNPGSPFLISTWKSKLGFKR